MSKEWQEAEECLKNFRDMMKLIKKYSPNNKRKKTPLKEKWVRG